MKGEATRKREPRKLGRRSGAIAVSSFWLLHTVLPALEVPAGFVAETIARDLNAATAIAPASDGRIFIADQTGSLLVWKGGRVLDRPALALRVTDYWERGLIGAALDPDFPRSPYIYLFYVTDRPFVHHVLSRFSAAGDGFDPASERILLEGDDQSKLGGGIPAGHQGGILRFGADGRLFAGIGEQTAGEPAQRLDTLQGKILRLNVDGSIPEDNPFFARAAGKYRAIFATGVRNPFGLAVQPKSDGGRAFFTDVGGSAFEEVNELKPGANYGWPLAEGVSANTALAQPLHIYPPVIGQSIVGGVFYPRVPAFRPDDARAFPEKWRGKFYFGDFVKNWIKALDPEAPAQAVPFAKGLNNPVATELAPDGSLLVLNRGTIWRDGKKFTPRAGSLVRIRYLGEAVPAPAAAAAAFQPVLSETGLFTSLEPLEPRSEFVEFAINLPPWQPGVSGRRWLSLPQGGKIRASAEGEWRLPPGARLIQHFDLDTSPARPFETQVLLFTGSRLARAAAWRWPGQGNDRATLVQDAEILSLPGQPGRQWVTPGAEEELSLDQPFTGFLVPISTRQLNHRRQLKEWNERGWLEPKWSPGELEKLPHLAALDDERATPEHRIRSYLDVNCAPCHYPGGPARGNYDARFSTPIERQNIINGDLLAGDLGIPGAKAIVPGQPEKSVLYLRMRRRDSLRMPPAALIQTKLDDEEQPVLPLLEEWIRSLR